jgi:hypothetical protein
MEQEVALSAPERSFEAPGSGSGGGVGALESGSDGVTDAAQPSSSSDPFRFSSGAVSHSGAAKESNAANEADWEDHFSA